MKEKQATLTGGFVPSAYEGKQDDIKKLKLPTLEVVKNMFPEVAGVVTIESDEINSICPRTGLPDFGKMCLTYTPDDVVVEEKALKMYLTAYRSIGIFKEFLTQKIFKDFVEATHPKTAHIQISFAARGGIPTTTVCRYDDGEYGFD